MLQRLQSLEVKLEARQKIQAIKDDIAVLKVRQASTRGHDRSSCWPAGRHAAASSPTTAIAHLPPAPQSIWFKKLRDTDCHKARLESFYGGQAHA